MRQPDSEHRIETAIDGEPVSGTVHHGGAWYISVRLDRPSNDWSTDLQIPIFARQAYREGFLGEYGEKRALELLVSLYEQHRKGDGRRKFAGADFKEFGRVRYLAVSPGHPAHGRKIIEQAEIDPTIYVQMEDDGPYRLARFHDSGTKQPFLAESAVFDESVQKYVAGVKADPTFKEYLKTTRRKLVPDMVRSAAYFKKHTLKPQQARFLADFGQAWRAGVIPLDAADIDELIQLGYLVRDSGLSSNEIAALESSLERSRAAMVRLEAEGKLKQAEQSRARVLKLQQRIDAKKLMITPAGKAAAKKLPPKTV